MFAAALGVATPEAQKRTATQPGCSTALATCAANLGRARTGRACAVVPRMLQTRCAAAKTSVQGCQGRCAGRHTLVSAVRHTQSPAYIQDSLECTCSYNLADAGHLGDTKACQRTRGGRCACGWLCAQHARPGRTEACPWPGACVQGTAQAAPPLQPERPSPCPGSGAACLSCRSAQLAHCLQPSVPRCTA